MPSLAASDATSRVYEILRDLVPIVHAPQPPTLELQSMAALALTATTGPLRMLDRQKRLSIAVLPTALVVETTAYTCFDDFSAVIARALDALAETAAPSGVQRVGMRYVDEIRVDGIESITQWEEYINPALIAGLHIENDYSPVRTESQVQFSINDRQKMMLRCGALDGFVVDPNGLLKVARISDGPFFLIDLDSFWIADEADIPEFDPGDVLERCTDLRLPVRAIFEASISDKLRDDVLRKEVDHV